MVYSVNLAPVPIRLRGLRRFEAHDPWDAGRLKVWSVSLFKLVPGQTAVSAQWAQIRPTAAQPTDEADPTPGGRPLRVTEAIGLEVDGGRHRMLPRVLQSAWAQGEVADERLPAVLAGLELELKRSDFFNAAGGKAARWIAGVFLGLVAALFLGVYIFGHPDPHHLNHAVDRAAWLAAPPREEEVTVGGGGLDVRPIARWDRPLRTPQGLTASETSTLGSYAAAGGRRLIFYDASAQLTPRDYAQGAVVRTDRLGLTPADLAAVGAGGPGLDTRYAFVFLGGWGAVDPLGVGDGRAVLALAALPIAPLLIVFAFWRLRDRRERRLRGRIADLTSSMRGGVVR